MAHGGYGKRRVKPAARRSKSLGVEKKAKPKPKAKPVTLKNQIRSIERMLRKDLPPDVREAQEKKLEGLKKQQEIHSRLAIERQIFLRDRKIKFFERRKVERRIRRLEKSQRSSSGQAQDAEIAEQLSKLKEDLEYVRFFPKTEKYVSLFTGGDGSDIVDSRNKLRKQIKANLVAAAASGKDLEETGSEDDGLLDLSEDDFFLSGSSSDEADADDEWTDKSTREQASSASGKAASGPFIARHQIFHFPQIPVSPNQMTLHQTNSCASCSIYLHVILFLFIILLCLQPTTAAPAPTNETDHLALLKFKESVPYDPYNILSSWNASVNFCNWLGITCDGRHQRVTALDLQGYKLRGSLSPYIGNLSFLRSIKLQNNTFYGEIPREVGNLFRLQELRLNNNTLEGQIPANLSKCSNLRFIHLHVNSFTGKIPMELGSLMKLEELQLLKNKLAGGIPPSLGNLSSLKSFAAEYNNLVGNIPDTIGRLKGLVVFSILMNKLSGMIPFSLYNVSSLQIFSVADNQLNGTLPINIGLNLPNLQVLQFGGNEFSGPIPTSLCNATHLQKIDLGMNNFLGSVPTNLGNLLDLFWLGLNGNYLGKSLHFLTSLTNCSKLVSVDLSKNQFQGVLPNSIANLSTNLTKLYFGVNEISGTIPASLENLVNLIGLGMDYNHFSGTIPTRFGRFQKMQLLALGGNNLSGEIPTIIGNLTRLFRLELQENRFEGTIPPSIVHCTNFQILDISQNNLNGSIPLELIGPSSLTLILLNLSYNSLTGKLPSEVGNLENINKLDVSNNNLLGEIPTSIGACLMLEHLNLQGNSFIGSIPSSMASLRGLQHLDVSQNNLSGSIPDGFKKLPFLESLNLSFNNFEGEVPTEGVFKNTNAISLIGNARLCGGIPNLKLPKCPVKVMKPWKSIGFRVAIIIIPIVLFICLLSSFLDLYWMKKSKKDSLSMVSIMVPSDFIYGEHYQALEPHNVTYKELYQATSGFSSNNLIGSGSFGSVYKGALNGNETLVAIKVLNLQQKGASKSFMAECNALRSIRHRNLVKIITCCSHMDDFGNEFKALVFEFMTNGSLDVWLHPGQDNENQSRNLSLLQRLNVAIDVATAINYLHNHSVLPIVHCDLKPSNILLDYNMVAHISDFGLARFRSTIEDSCLKETITTGLKGSIGYVAPEYGMGCDTSTKGDVYSYGIIILEMFLGKRPTDEKFKDGLNLHNYAKKAVAQPERLVQIVDPILRREVEERLVQMDAIVRKCLFPILQLGLACSAQSPKERMNMEEVTRTLHLIKNAYISSGICKGGPLSSGIQVEGKWNEIMLQQFFEENLKQIPIPRRATPDKLVWLGETSGNFSLKSSYLTEHGDRFDQKYNQDWKKLWESKLHERLKMFLWRLAKGELPLKTRLANSIGCEDLSCVLCGEAEESELHVFRDCIVIRMLWFASEIGLRWDHFEANSAVELVQMILKPPEELITEGLNQNKFTLMAAVICYETWRMRQLMLSKNVKFDPMEFPWRIKSAMESFSPRKESDRQCKEREKEEGWCPPPRGWIKIKVDASWSEGKATVAGLARNCRGEFLKAWAERVDAESVAIAECLAIGLAIQAAIEEGYEQVKIEGDAKIVFDAICNTGQSECWELHQYVEMIRSVVKESETPKFRFNWVLTGFLGF